METIFSFFCQRKQFFFQRILETYFSTNSSFRVVETDFLASTNHNFFPRLVETYFLTNPSFQLLEKDFWRSVNHILYQRVLSYQPKPSPIWVEIISQKRTLFLLVETHFLASENDFLPLPQIFFKKFFIPANGNTFFSPEEKLQLYTQSFLSCWWKTLFKLKRSLFKILITTIGNGFR